MRIDPITAFYVLPLIAVWGIYAMVRGRAEAHARATRTDAINAGLGETSTLHPVIDTTLCIGCKACISACPEGNILGLINNKAELIGPSNCVGHGACKAACPRGAISLVFGSATRGVDLPVVGSDFQSTVPGIYIAGELGGMGLIRNAVEQGRQAMREIGRRARARDGRFLDVVIVGSGPAGLAAGLGAIELGLRYVVLEQDTLGGAIAHFPRGKVVMTAPARLPIVGEIKFTEVGKDSLLSFWKDVVHRTGLAVHAQERVDDIRFVGGGFLVQSSRRQYLTRHVVLAIGRRGTPRRLDVPGEDHPKVVYGLADPEQFRGKHVLVVGGGDSALEAAASLAQEPGTNVTLSYRGEAFLRAKTKNRASVEQAAAERRLSVLLASQVTRIDPDRVVISRGGQSCVLRNDAVIVCAGGVLPTNFLKSIGIGIETKYGTA